MSGTNEEVLHPAVVWAQRKNLVYVNIALEDCKVPVIEITKDRLVFKGVGGTDKKKYEADMELFSSVNPEASKYIVGGRGTQFVLIKEDASSSFWKRLLKSDKKYHWLKVDFGKWKDEEDSEDESGGGGMGMGMPGGMGGGPGGPGGGDFEEMMRQMGGLGGAGGGPPDLGDLGDEKDSDDEELPDLED